MTDLRERVARAIQAEFAKHTEIATLSDDVAQALAGAAMSEVGGVRDFIGTTAVAAKIRSQLYNSPNRKTFRKTRKTLLEIAIALEVANKTISDIALEPAPVTPAQADLNKEYAIDTIEEIVGETHDLDVTDRQYAVNIVSWLERHHPQALRAIAEQEGA